MLQYTYLEMYVNVFRNVTCYAYTVYCHKMYTILDELTLKAVDHTVVLFRIDLHHSLSLFLSTGHTHLQLLHRSQCVETTCTENDKGQLTHYNYKTGLRESFIIIIIIIIIMFPPEVHQNNFVLI